MRQITRFKWSPKPESRTIVFDALQPAIRYEKADCLDLPEVTYQTREVPLSPQVQKYYNELKKEMLIKAVGEQITTVNAAAALNKLLQISGGAVYTDNHNVREFDVSPRLRVLEEVMKTAERKGVREVHEGDWVLVRRGGLGRRPKSKLQSRYMGPFLVVDRSDPTESLVRCQHLSTKQISLFHMSDLQGVSLEHFREVSDAAPLALRDEWTYMVDAIVGHRPGGPRRTGGGRLRAKSASACGPPLHAGTTVAGGASAVAAVAVAAAADEVAPAGDEAGGRRHGQLARVGL